MIVVSWTVEDGFVGNGEHEFEFDGWEEEQYLGMDKAARDMYLDDLIHQEFQDNVSFSVVGVAEIIEEED